MTRRQSYFWKQRVIGLCIIITSIIVPKIFEDILMIGVMTMPMGFILLFTKQMVIVDSYFRDEEEKEL